MYQDQLKGRSHVGDAALTNRQGDRIIIRPSRLVMFLCGGAILRTARKLVNRAHERGMIGSHALHELHALIDRSLK